MMCSDLAKLAVIQSFEVWRAFSFLVSSLGCVRGLDLFLSKGFRASCGFWLGSSLGGHGTADGRCLFSFRH